MTEVEIVTAYEIESRIYTIRGVQVMLDRDLAVLYEVPVKVLNQSVNRNIDRFPQDFRFQLTKDEFEILNLKSQIVTSSSHGGVRKLPYAFTEQGLSMLSTVLRSETAIKVSIQIMQAFLAMRKSYFQLGGIVQRIENVEQKQIDTDKKIVTFCQIELLYI